MAAPRERRGTETGKGAALRPPPPEEPPLSELEFTGCKAVPMSYQELLRYEGRLEVWDAKTRSWPPLSPVEARRISAPASGSSGPADPARPGRHCPSQWRRRATLKPPRPPHRPSARRPPVGAEIRTTPAPPAADPRGQASTLSAVAETLREAGAGEGTAEAVVDTVGVAALEIRVWCAHERSTRYPPGPRPQPGSRGPAGDEGWRRRVLLHKQIEVTDAV